MTEKITEEVDDEAAITEPPRWSMEVCLTIRRIEPIANSSNKPTRIGIRISEIEDRRVIELYRIGNGWTNE